MQNYICSVQLCERKTNTNLVSRAFRSLTPACALFIARMHIAAADVVALSLVVYSDNIGLPHAAAISFNCTTDLRAPVVHSNDVLRHR